MPDVEPTDADGERQRDRHDVSPGVLESFISRDRRAALAERRSIPDRLHGAGLFADISGFTPLTEALVDELGEHRGAEELGRTLDQVYQALIDDLGRHRGEVLYFSGDAITCWLDGDDGSRAVQCALDMQETVRRVGRVDVGARTVILSVKVAVATGHARRLVVGDPAIQRLDVLAGRLLDHLAASEGMAAKGDVIADESVIDALGTGLVCREIRLQPGGRRCGLVGELAVTAPRPTAPPRQLVGTEEMQPWLLPEVFDRLTAGGGAFLAELRVAHPIFVRFGGFDFDRDPAVNEALDGFIRHVQHVLHRYDGTLLGITVGDKGAYLIAVVGALRSHEDDAVRAVAAAVEIRDLEETTAAADLQIGVSAGQLFSGTYGHTDRRTYSVLGDPTNVAARLMGAAPPGEVYVLAEVADAAGERFIWADLPPLTLKGKAETVRARSAVLARRRSPQRVLRYPLPMVGRAREVAVAAGCLSAVERGEQALLTVTADAGMGKSRFVADVLRDAERRGLPVVYGHAEPLGASTSYTVWRGVWRAVFGLDDDRPDATQIRDVERVLTMVDPQLAGRLPLVGAVVALDVPDNDLVAPFDAKLRKSSLENLLADVLVDRLRAGPLIIVLEDLQWIDPPSQDLLETLVRETAGLPVLFLMSRRPGTEVALPAAIFGGARRHEVELGDLDDEGMRSVVAAKAAQLFGANCTPSDALVALVLERAAGNPFYAEELLNYVHRLDRNPSDPDAVDPTDVPDSLSAIVLSRIDGLDERPRQALKVASVIGRDFSADMLGSVHGALGDSTHVVDRLAPARAVDLVTPEDELLVDWLFRHAITRDVAYESLPFATRVSLHARTGDVIVASGDAATQLDVVAHHFWHADDLDKKRHYLRLAADAARDRYANESAVEHFRRLVTIVPDGERAGILLELAAVLEVSGEWDRAEAISVEARDLADAAGDSVRSAWSDVSLAELARKRGNYDDATALLRRARSAFDDHGEEAGSARVFHLLGTIAAQRGDLDDARHLYEQSLERRERLEDSAGVAAILSNLGVVAEYDGDFEASKEFHARSLDLRRSIGDRWAIAVSFTNLGMIAVHQERYDEARTLFDQAMQLNVEVGDAWMVAIAHNNLGNATRGLGDVDAARAHYGQSLARYQQYGDRWALAFLFEDIAMLAAGDDLVVALELLGAADALRSDIDAPRPEPLAAELAGALDRSISHVTPRDQERARSTGRALTMADAVARAASYCQHDGKRDER